MVIMDEKPGKTGRFESQEDFKNDRAHICIANHIHISVNV